jgi:hypothetical protein
MNFDDRHVIGGLTTARLESSEFDVINGRTSIYGGDMGRKNPVLGGQSSV